MKKPIVHLICSAHLDPVWQWRWEEGCAEALTTFRNAAQILGEHDELVFNHNEAVLYQWVERYDPALFGEIRRLVAGGRWSISGGWYLQPDVNMPGLESLVRQIVEGRKYFQEKFGARPLVAYNFDSFGHSGGLPQILKLAGYRMYIHMRPQSNELALPSDLYRWRGVDGSEVIGLRISVGLYHTERDNIEQRLREGVALALKLNRDVPVFWGLGNHGGGATREDLRRIDAFIQKERRVDIVHSTPDRLFEALKDAAREAPVVEGDLQRVFTGCYTSLARVKRRAQESLGRLVQAEGLRAASWWAFGQEYPEQELREAWRSHLFNDFHDVLTGSCIEPAEQDALDIYGKVAESVRGVRMGAAASFNAGMGEGRSPALPVTVLNTNPSLPACPVEVECMADYRPLWKGKWHLRLLGSDGREIPCQEEQPESLLPFNDWRRKLTFKAELPGLGCRHYHVELVRGRRRDVSPKPYLKYRIDRNMGFITSLDAGGGRECLAGPLFLPLVVEDRGDSWGTGCRSYRKVAGRFKPLKRSLRVIRKGPVRTLTEAVYSWGKSRIAAQIYAYACWPVLELRLRILWNEEHRRLKLAVPTVFHAAQVLCEVPGGAIFRPADGEEHVQGRWLLLQGRIKNKETALAIVNSGQHGFDFLKGEVRLSILRSAAYCHERGFSLDKTPVLKCMDQGVHDVRLLVTAGNLDEVRASVSGLADWLSAPPVAYAHLPFGSPESVGQRPQGEKRPGFLEVFSLRPASIRLAACKRSGDGEALIVRLHETAGVAANFELKLLFPAQDIGLSFKPFEIKTLRIEKNGEWREADSVDEK